MIRAKANKSDPVRSPDPIAFISVFAAVLHDLVPSDVSQRFLDEIYKVMCELVEIAKGADWPLSTRSRKRCVEEIDPAFWELYLRRGFESPCSVPLYLFFAPLQYKAYKPLKNYPISYQSLRASIRLIQANPASAGFSFLTMYSIRHHTLNDNTDSFDVLFPSLNESERALHGIGKLRIPSLYPLQLIGIHRGSIPIEPPHRIKVSYPFPLEPTARRVG